MMVSSSTTSLKHKRHSWLYPIDCPPPLATPQLLSSTDTTSLSITDCHHVIDYCLVCLTLPLPSSHCCRCEQHCCHCQCHKTPWVPLPPPKQGGQRADQSLPASAMDLWLWGVWVVNLMGKCQPWFDCLCAHPQQNNNIITNVSTPSGKVKLKWIFVRSE